MPLPENPLLFAFPLFRLGAGLTPLGCGFFVRDDGTFLTAQHVLPGEPLQPGERLVAGLHRDGGIRIADVDLTSLRSSSQFDIAAGRIENADPLVALAIANADPPANIDLMCLEFSRIQAVLPPRPGMPTEMQIRGANQRGHMVSGYVSDLVNGAPSHVVELSFPAMAGASGSAVLSTATGDVVGMLVSNVAYHLLPAHLERVEHPGGHFEELRYYLPHALAISWRHLRPFVESM